MSTISRWLFDLTRRVITYKYVGAYHYTKSFTNEIKH